MTYNYNGTVNIDSVGSVSEASLIKFSRAAVPREANTRGKWGTWWSVVLVTSLLLTSMLKTCVESSTNHQIMSLNSQSYYNHLGGGQEKVNSELIRQEGGASMRCSFCILSPPELTHGGCRRCDW